MGFALIYYAVSGRKWFKGPRINVEHVIHGVTMEGEDTSGASPEGIAEKI
jgi:hypothetical protein